MADRGCRASGLWRGLRKRRYRIPIIENLIAAFDDGRSSMMVLCLHVSLHLAKLSDAVRSVLRGLIWESGLECLTASARAHFCYEWSPLAREDRTLFHHRRIVSLGASHLCGQSRGSIHVLPSARHERQKKIQVGRVGSFDVIPIPVMRIRFRREKGCPIWAVPP